MLNYDLVDRRYKKDVNHVQLDPIYEKYYIKRVAQLMSKAQRRIAKVYRGWRYKRLRKEKGIYSASLFWTAEGKEIEIVGEFTCPKWTTSVRLEYNSFFQAYETCILIPEGTMFKFKIDGVFRISNDYTFKSDKNGNHNNVFMLNHNHQNSSFSIGFSHHSVSQQSLSYESDGKMGGSVFHPTIDVFDTLEGADIPHIHPSLLHIPPISPSPSPQRTKHQDESDTSTNHSASAQEYEEENKEAVGEGYKISEEDRKEEKRKRSYLEEVDKEDKFGRLREDNSLRRRIPSIETIASINTLKTNKINSHEFVSPSQSPLLPIPVVEFPRVITGLDLLRPESLNEAYVNQYSFKDYSPHNSDFYSLSRDPSANDIREVIEYKEECRECRECKECKEYECKECGDIKNVSGYSEDIYIRDEELIFATGWKMIGKEEAEGEDAMMATERGLGVADGVSGWSLYGLNAAQFSQELMDNCKLIINQAMNKPLIPKSGSGVFRRETNNNNKLSRVRSYNSLIFEESDYYMEEEHQRKVSNLHLPQTLDEMFEIELDPLEVITKSYKQVCSVGSSTACVCVLNREGIMRVSNLGDSGFVVLRFNKDMPYNVSMSKEQQHDFNIPYQLAKLPGETEFKLLRETHRFKEFNMLKKALQNGNMCMDLPSLADTYQVELKDGDVVLVATDGVWDNLYIYEIRKMIKEIMMKSKKLTKCKLAQKIADKLTDEAFRRSRLKTISTPFQKKFRKHYQASWEGGKEDDITVVVGCVTTFKNST